MTKIAAIIGASAFLACAGQAQAFENVRIDFETITALSSAMTDADSGYGDSAEQQRIIISGIGRLRFDKSVSEFANRNNLHIRLNLPRGVSPKRRSGRNAALLTRAERGHANACLDFATRVLTDSKTFNLRVWSEETGIAAGAYKRNKDANGREILIVRINEDHFEDVRCTIYRTR